MAATHLKKVGMEKQKAGKVGGTKKKQLHEHFIAYWITWKQVSDMTGTLEMQSKDGQSLICKTLNLVFLISVVMQLEYSMHSGLLVSFVF